jgi:hypothetical protein
MVFGFLLSGAGFVLVAYVAFLGHPVTAASIGTGLILSLATTFVLGRRLQARRAAAQSPEIETSPSEQAQPAKRQQLPPSPNAAKRNRRKKKR